MNINEYEQRCLDADKELAELLGWTNINYDIHQELIGLSPEPSFENFPLFVPRWTLDDAEALRLAVEYSINWKLDKVYDEIVSNELVTDIGYNFPDDISAIRYHIVQCAIRILKGNNK